MYDYLHLMCQYTLLLNVSNVGFYSLFLNSYSCQDSALYAQQIKENAIMPINVYLHLNNYQYKLSHTQCNLEA